MIAIDIPFRFNSSTVASTTSYRTIVRNQIVDTLMTNFRERIMRPGYGSDILSMVMASQDRLQRSDAAALIRERLVAQVPRADIRSVSLIPHDREPSRMTVVVSYSVGADETLEKLEVPVSSSGTMGA